MNETEMIKNRIIDLSRMSFERGIYTHSDFLTLAQQSDFSDLSHTKALFSHDYSLFGGYEGAERVMVRFGSENTLGYDQAWPIACIKILPLNHKFAEELSHRDILGSLMNLGIERTLLGDIIVPKKSPDSITYSKSQACAYIFAKDHIAETLCKELTRIRHTSVMASIIDNPEDVPKPTLQEMNLQVKSERIDLIVAHVYNLSRSQSAELFLEGKVFVAGRLSENESHILSSKDLVSVRGYGRFIYNGVIGNTRKGNLNISVSKYV